MTQKTNIAGTMIQFGHALTMRPFTGWRPALPAPA